MNERNVVINIDTLNLSVGPARPGISDVLASLIGNAGMEVHAEPQAEPQPEQEAEVTHEDVLDFLQPDERYTMRTFNAIAKNFPGVHRDRLSDLLTDLTIDGDVQTRTRRRDGVTLYEAA